jgi:hypothetical protein
MKHRVNVILHIYTDVSQRRLIKIFILTKAFTWNSKWWLSFKIRIPILGRLVQFLLYIWTIWCVFSQFLNYFVTEYHTVIKVCVGTNIADLVTPYQFQFRIAKSQLRFTFKIVRKRLFTTFVYNILWKQ